MLNHPAANRHAQLSGPAPGKESPNVTGLTIGVLALFALLYMAFGRLTDFYLPSLHLPFIASVICLIAAIAARNIFAVFHSKLGLMFAGLTIWLLAAIPFSLWRGGSFEVVTNTWFKSFALFVVVGALLQSVAQCSKVLIVLAGSFLTAALLALGFGEYASGRFAMVQGLYSGANELAMAMVQGFVFWWFMVHRSTRSGLLRVLSVIPFVPMFYLLAKTGSRAAFVVLAVLAVLLFFYYQAPGRIIYLMVLGIAVLVSLFTLPQTAKLRLATLFSSDISVSSADSATQLEMTVGSSEQRLRLLKASIALTFRHPIFGVGPGQFAVADDQEAKATNLQRGVWLGTHNTYTQVSSEAGIPALLFFVGSMFFCWRELRAVEHLSKKAPSPQASELRLTAYTLRLALVSFAVFFCMEHIAYDPFYPALAGVVSALSRITRQQFQTPALAGRPA